MIKLFREYINENLDIWNDDLKGKIYTIAERMVELEDKFIDLAFAMGPMENLSAEEVKKAYRNMAKKFHPDKLQSKDPALIKGAQEKFQEVQKAYEAIQKERDL